MTALFVVAIITTKEVKAGCEMTTPTVDSVTFLGTCTWGDYGHYCELLINPYINCSVNSY